MLSGYDFSNCDIPVRLNHIYIFFYLWILKWMWRLSKEFLKIRRQEAVLRKAVLWTGSSQHATMTGEERSEFPFFPVQKSDWKTEISWKKNKQNKTKSNLQRTKKEKQVKVFSPSPVCLVWTETRSTDGGAVRCTWHETWGQPVQPVQQTTTRATTRQRQERGGAIISGEGGRGLGCGGWGVGHVTADLLNDVQRKKKEEEKTTLAEHSLKLCWVVIGWLPPLSHFLSTDADGRCADTRLYDNIYTVLTAGAKKTQKQTKPTGNEVRISRRR